MFTPGSSVHVGQDFGEAKDSDSYTQIPYSAPEILRDERRSHAAEIAAAMHYRVGTHSRIDAMVNRFSRFAGVGLFALTLGSVGWMVTGWL